MLWLISGIIIGFGIHWMISRVKAGKISIDWYQWILGIIAVVVLLFTIQNYLGFQKELEPVAANFVLLAMGLPGVILALLACFLPRVLNRTRSNSKSRGENAAG